MPIRAKSPASLEGSADDESPPQLGQRFRDWVDDPKIGVVVGGVEKAGIAGRLLAALQPLHPQSVWGLTLIAAILSNLVSNVPAVMVLKSLVPHLPDPVTAWLTLAMSSTLAGNLTLPGSLATVIVAERAKGRATISFLDFLKVGAPSAILSLLIGAAWLAWVR